MFARISAGFLTLWLAAACSSTPAADALVGKCNSMCTRATSGGCGSACTAGGDCATLTAAARARGCAAPYEALLDCALAGDTCSALMGTIGSCSAAYSAYYACTEPDAGP